MYHVVILIHLRIGNRIEIAFVVPCHVQHIGNGIGLTNAIRGKLHTLEWLLIDVLGLTPAAYVEITMLLERQLHTALIADCLSHLLFRHARLQAIHFIGTSFNAGTLANGNEHIVNLLRRHVEHLVLCLSKVEHHFCVTHDDPQVEGCAIAG